MIVLFTGGVRTENIRLWDIRARNPVYALSTGNNEVGGLQWVEDSQTLLASTRSSRMDRNGSTFEYRGARIRTHVPKNPGDPWPALPQVYPEDEDSLHPEPTDQPPHGGSWDEQSAWPEKSHYNEFAFGAAFDAGEHRLCRFNFHCWRRVFSDLALSDRYNFKDTADINVLPVYGDAQPGDPSYW